MAPEKTAEYTLEQVAEANTSEKAWIVIHGNVYNVSSYLYDHPGGRDVLLELAGGDATSDFDFVGHSKSAAKAMAEFQVGTLAGYTVAPKRESRQKVMVSAARKRQPGGALLRDGVVPGFATLFFLFVAGLYWGVDAITRLYEGLNGAFTRQFAWLNVLILLTLAGGSLIVAARSYWHSLFHYKGVFEYPAHYTVR